MPHVKRQKIKIKLQVILATLLLVVGFFVSNNSSQAAIGLQIGTSTLILNNGENLMYGNINGSSDAGSNLLLLKNASSPKFLITSSGNVGIGTTGPGEKLDVLNGNIQISGNGTHLILNPSSGLQSGIGWKSPGLSFSFALNDNSSGVTNQSGSSYGGYMLLNSTAGSEGFHFINKPAGGSDTEAFTIQGTTGNVGIGTTNPQQVLSVNGNILTNSMLVVGATGGNGLLLNATGSNYGAIQNVASSTWGLGWGAGSISNTIVGTALSWNSAGNVGIGTTAPNDIFSIGNTGVAPAGSSNTGHNFTSTYLSADNYALANTGYVKSLIAAATSTISTSTGMVSSIFVTIASSTGSLSYTGGYVGYDAGNKICNAALTGSHFCRTDEIVYLIQANGASSFSAINGLDAWIADGPPGYTGVVSADDCGGWVDSTNNKLGHFWIFASSGGGRGSLSSCDTIKKITCCK